VDSRIITAVLAVVLVPIALYGYIVAGEWVVTRLPRRIG
jgi:hypothetical protein